MSDRQDNKYGGRPEHQHRHRHHNNNKPYERRDGYHNHRNRGGGGGYHDNRRGGFRRGGYHDNTAISPEVEVEVKLLFNKSYVFEGDFPLPHSGSWFTEQPYKVEELQLLKESLNRTKDKLDDKDKEVWHRHTRFTNPAGNIMRTVRNELSAELLTQAWAKFYEMAGKIVPDSPSLTSVHICEAPGGFICALNHYLKRNNPECDWSWFGMTLNPYFEGNTSKEMVDDDLFISKTYSHWYFGGDNSGNIMNCQNILDLKARIAASSEKETSVMLVTADGSIDCQDNPNEQEATVAHLHYCETVSAVTLLSPGGNFLLKGFTLFEHSTLCLTYLLCCLFDKVEVVKPLTSKSGNSETYTLCTGFRGISPDHLSELQKHHSLNDTNRAFFARSDIPDEFMAKFIECSKKFMSYQQNMIESNIWTFECLEHQEKQLLFQKKKFAVEHYMKTVCRRLGPISVDQRLVRDVYLDGTKLNTTSLLSSDGKRGSNRRQQTQSHSEAQQERSLPWFDRVVLPELTPITDTATPQSFGEQMLAKMGYQSGQGLGKEGGGMTEPIQVKQLEAGTGLGYEVNPINTAVVKTPSDITWFDRPLLSSSPSSLPTFTTTGRSLTHVTNSRFLSVDTLLKLNDAERHSSVIRSSELNELAKSVHAYYAMSAMGMYDAMDVRLTFLNKLTGILDGEGRVGGDLSSGGVFTPHFTRRCAKCRTIDQLESDNHKPDLDIAAFDTTSKPAILRSMQVLVRHLKPGGNCVVNCHKLQDRFTTSLVYLITRLFKSTSLIKTKTCCPHTPDFFVVGRHFDPCSITNIDPYLAHCIRSLDSAHEIGKDLLEILPISLLFEPSFYKFISCYNEKVSQDAVDTIIDLEKMNYQSKFPSGKSNQFIMECMSCME